MISPTDMDPLGVAAHGFAVLGHTEYSTVHYIVNRKELSMKVCEKS